MHNQEFAELLLVPKIVRPLSSPVPVSTLTTLMAFEEVGRHYSMLLFAMVNLSLVDTVTFRVETSETGVHPDEYRTYNIEAPPQKQASLELGPVLLRHFFRLSAFTTSPAFPTAFVQWMIRGVAR